MRNSTPPIKAPAGSVPAKAGTGLKFPHVDHILEARPHLGWFEVHAENFMIKGGRPREILHEVAATYPVSIHGVGLSLGSADGLDHTHLERLANLVTDIRPGLVSEHLAWCRSGATCFSDLLPLPYTAEALEVVSANVSRAQDRLGRQILVENPSLYVDFTISEMRETEFLNVLTERTGCGLLLDVNNIHVSGTNLGYDPAAYLRELDCGGVGEIHLAGHHVRQIENGTILIDDHGGHVAEPVWHLFEQALAKTGPVPVQIEWDNNVPTFDVLAGEVAKADSILDRCFNAEVRNVCAA